MQDYAEAIQAAQETAMTSYCCSGNTCARCVAFDLATGDYTRFVSMWRRIAECYRERFTPARIEPDHVKMERRLRNDARWRRRHLRVASRNMPDLKNAIEEVYKELHDAARETGATYGQD